MELVTARLLLRPFVPSDVARVNAYESDPEVVRYLMHGPRSLTDSLACLERTLEETRGAEPLVHEFAIVRRQDSRVIGRCGMRLTEPKDREAMLWYVLARPDWGFGYAVEAAHAVIAFGFDELRLHRVFLDIDPRNVASIRVAEKLAFRREAHLVENAWVKGEWADTLIFAFLDREFRQLKAERDREHLGKKR